jgi:hypothetical protein
MLVPIALVAIACSSPPTQEPTAAVSRSVDVEPGVPGGTYVETVQLSARVTAIDKDARKATLLGPDGEELSVAVGPDAVNFDRIEVGDMVDVTLIQELVIALQDEGTPQGDGAAAAVSMAPKGAEPGGAIAQTRWITGTVTALDPEAQTATLRFADGSIRTLPVRADVDLTRRKVGEQVVFQVTEMVAIDISKP